MSQKENSEKSNPDSPAKDSKAIQRSSGWIKIALLAIVVLVILFICCICGITSYYAYKGIGSGNVISEDRDLDSFKEITLEGSYNLILEQGSKESVTVKAEDNIMPKIVTEVKGDELRVHYKREFPYVFSGLVFPREDIEIHATVKDLDEVTISGSGGIKGKEQLTLDSLKVNIEGSGDVDLDIKAFEIETNISGSGDINFKGEADNQIIKIAGSGGYAAKELESETVEITITGSGDVVVNVEKELDVDIDGSGKVKYLGNPDVSQDISGSGSVEKY